MGLKTILFDLDGTLLDTAPDLANALNQTLALHNRTILPFSKIRPFVSDGANAMLEMGFGIARTSQDMLPLRQDMLEFYLQDIATQTRPFPGIQELIDTISHAGLKWGIVTNKPVKYAQELMHAVSSKNFFTLEPKCVICPEHVKDRKPAPDALFLACEQSDCTPQESIYIGDHLRDIEAGKNANMQTIAAAYGYVSKHQNPLDWKADFTVEHADEIWPIVSKLYQ